ncbi:hypothetical protein DUB99_13690 [Salmonella enterica subsp. enterica serovar Bonariensis]|nr:hypothetical protein [Salmonella enterica subsp. enterica serovar Bonariensis]EAO5616403.1 hypothetical protein [Salmonella enterica]EDT7938419.1 hypothetical protein [Salmonella enterica subsp. enterica serovar Aba]EBE1258889.1 hypothetical protein [Salmonella enterica]EBE4735654.1 hypothetical protein [Salmonella enterica]
MMKITTTAFCGLLHVRQQYFDEIRKRENDFPVPVIETQDGELWGEMQCQLFSDVMVSRLQSSRFQRYCRACEQSVKILMCYSQMYSSEKLLFSLCADVTDEEEWRSLHNTHAQRMSESVDAMAGDVKSLGKLLQSLRSEQGLLACSEDSPAKSSKTLSALAAIEKEFSVKVKKLSQRYADYDFYLQGNVHLNWIFPANAEENAMDAFVQANRLQSSLKQSQVSRIMKLARDFRSRAASFKATAVAITGDALVADSAYREFMQRNPTLLTNQRQKEQEQIRAQEVERHQRRSFIQKFAVWFVRVTGA